MPRIDTSESKQTGNPDYDIAEEDRLARIRRGDQALIRGPGGKHEIFENDGEAECKDHRTPRQYPLERVMGWMSKTMDEEARAKQQGKT